MSTNPYESLLSSSGVTIWIEAIELRVDPGPLSRRDVSCEGASEGTGRIRSGLGVGVGAGAAVDSTGGTGGDFVARFGFRFCGGCALPSVEPPAPSLTPVPGRVVPGHGPLFFCAPEYSHSFPLSLHLSQVVGSPPSTNDFPG